MENGFVSLLDVGLMQVTILGKSRELPPGLFATGWIHRLPRDIDSRRDLHFTNFDSSFESFRELGRLIFEHDSCVADVMAKCDMSPCDFPLLFRRQGGEKGLEIKGSKGRAIGEHAARLWFDCDLNQAARLFVKGMQSSCELPPLAADLLGLFCGE